MSIDLGGLTEGDRVLPRTIPERTSSCVSPDQNVVYTGDLLFSGWYPVCFDREATVSGWRDTLKKFAGFDKDTLFVPGHGQICGQGGHRFDPRSV